MKKVIFLIIIISFFGCYDGIQSEKVIQGIVASTVSNADTIKWKETEGIAPSICWMGDSRIEFFKNEDYFNNHQWNIGLRGATILEVVKRVPYVQMWKPDITIISIGINDEVLYSYNDDFFENMKMTIKSLKPFTRLIITNVVPLTSFCLQRQNMNEKIKNLCIVEGVEFLDLVDMEISDGILNPAYAVDACHYNSTGYAVFVNAIKTVL